MVVSIKIDTQVDGLKEKKELDYVENDGWFALKAMALIYGWRRKEIKKVSYE